ncbi:unnamed protein product [Closterium sp. NIES-53]
MEVARTSMIHAAAPHFLWPFAVQYAAHLLNLCPCVSLPETSPILRWTGEVGDASVFRVLGSRAFVQDTLADKLSPCAIPCVIVGFVPDAPGWQFYHPTSHRVFPSEDVTFDESVPFYRLFPFRSAPPPPLPLYLAPGPPPVVPLPPQGPAPSSVSQADPLPCPALVQVAVDSVAARGAASGVAASGGAEPGGAEPGGVETGGAEPRGVATRGAKPGGAEPEGVEAGGAALEGAEPQGSSSSGAGGAGPAGAGGLGVAAGAGVTGGVATTGPGGVRTRGTGAAGTGGVEGTGVGDLTESGAGVESPGDGGARDRGAGAVDPGEHREPASHLVLPVCTARRVPRSRPPTVPCTHAMNLCPSSACSSACSSWVLSSCGPTVSRLLATAVTDPFFESASASALVTELLDFTAAYRLDYATVLVAESACARTPSVGGECALGKDILEDRQEYFECLAVAVPRFASMVLAPEGDPNAPHIPTPRSYAEAITGPYSSQWQAPMDAEMASWKYTGTYVDEVPPPGANIVDGMWIFRVKRPPGLPPTFKARYIARGLSQRQGVNYFHTFSPTLKMTTLRVLLHVAAQRDYELHSLDFSTAFLQGSMHKEIWLRRPPGFTESFPAALGFAPATPYPSLFLRTDTSLPPFYVLVYITRDRGVSKEPSGPYPELVGCLMYLMTCTQPDLAYPLSLLARYVAPGRHRKGYTFSLGSAPVSWRSTRSSLVISSNCEAKIYAGAMAEQELRWLTYLLTDLGEQPRYPLVLYVDNKAMIALCQEHRLEHRTKHIAVRYFLARELQQHGQLRLAYVATRANTADVFTKALPPGDHQRFVTLLGLLALLS